MGNDMTSNLKQLKISDGSKSVLARLMARENISVEHSNTAETAAFDTVNRTLILPAWRMDNEAVYNMLVAHEVSHALFTANTKKAILDGFNRVNTSGDDSFTGNAKAIWNICEDARIEKLILRRFPGLKRDFYDAYKHLVAKAVLDPKNISADMLLADKINYFAKANIHLPDIPFTDVERVLLNETLEAETIEDSIEVARKVFDYMLKNMSKDDSYSNTDMVEGNGESTDSPSGSERRETDETGTGTEDDSDKSDSDNKPNDTSDGDKSDKDDNGPESKGAGSGSDENDDKGENGLDGAGAGDETGAGKESDNASDAESKTNGSAESKPDSDSNESGIDDSVRTKESPDRTGARGRAGEGVSKLSDPTGMMPKSDGAFNEFGKELVDDSKSEYAYARIPEFKSLDRIIPYKEVMNDLEVLRERSDAARCERAFNKFASTNRDIVNFMALEFERKKAADSHRKTLISKTGMIDTNRLHAYRVSDDIFHRSENTPSGKSHGMIMFIDWSSSMDTNLKPTILQTLVLVMFCERINIPFDVYLFSDGHYSREKIKCIARTNELKLSSDARFPHVLSSRMSKRERRDAMLKMFMISSSGSRSLPRNYHLSGTPLNETIVAAFDIVEEFKERTQTDILNVAFLTDGCGVPSNIEDSNGNTHSSGYNGYYSHRSKTDKFFIRDEKTRIDYNCADFSGPVSQHAALLKMLSDRHGVKTVGFFISSRRGFSRENVGDWIKDYSVRDHETGAEKVTKHTNEIRENYFTVLEGEAGYDELYMIDSRYMNMSASGFKRSKSSGTASNIAEEYKNAAHEKKMSRVLLSRFIELVAAKSD